MLDILRPVQGLEKSLNKSEAKIKDTYGRSVSTFGRWYLDALGNDRQLDILHHRIPLLIIPRCYHQSATCSYNQPPGANQQPRRVYL